MKLRPVFAIPLLLLMAGCGYDDGVCGPPVPIAWDEVDGRTFVTNSTCEGPEMMSPVNLVEMRIEREEGRIYISYDARGVDREIVRVEEVWTFDP